MTPLIRKTISILILIAFLATSTQSPAMAQSAGSPTPWMPAPGTMVHLSPEFTPAHLKGITIHPDNGLMFDFIIQRGDEPLSDSQKQVVYKNLIKYFLASLAVPDENQWVNLSPYEKNRIITDDFGKTEMGRDLLAQDYILKQITASLIYPEEGLGKKFWDKVYTQAQQQFGTTNIPVNTFNKVWIVPDDALVYETGNTAYVLKNHLKVMLEQDYLSLEKNSSSVIANHNVSLRGAQATKQSNKEIDTSTLGSQIVREIVLPALEKEVNEGKNFAMLRQVYSGMILAAWYKRTLKESLLGKIYANQAKVKGVDQPDAQTNQEIYQQYLKAYKKGVYNYIKEDIDKLTNQPIPRKYFSGGTKNDYAMVLQTTRDSKNNAAMIADAAVVDTVVTAVEEPGEVAVLASQLTDAEQMAAAILESRTQEALADIYDQIRRAERDSKITFDERDVLFGELAEKAEYLRIEEKDPILDTGVVEVVRRYSSTGNAAMTVIQLPNGKVLREDEYMSFMVLSAALGRFHSTTKTLCFGLLYLKDTKSGFKIPDGYMMAPGDNEQPKDILMRLGFLNDKEEINPLYAGKVQYFINNGGPFDTFIIPWNELVAKFKTGGVDPAMTIGGVGYKAGMFLAMMTLFGMPENEILAQLQITQADLVQEHFSDDQRSFTVARLRIIFKEIQKHAGDVMNSFVARTDDGRNLKVAKTIAKFMHKAWLTLELRSAKNVKYNFDIHEFLLKMIKAGVITTDTGKRIVTSADVSDKPNKMFGFLDPMQKFKFNRSSFDFSKLDDPMVSAAVQMTRTKAVERLDVLLTQAGIAQGGEFQFNTVALEADDSIALYSGKAQDARKDFIYGLQRDSEGSTLAALFENPKLLEDLASGDKIKQRAAIIEIARWINVGWRLNSYGSLQDRLLRQPFGLAKNGGIGIMDILKDLIAFNETMKELNRAITEERIEEQVDLPKEVADGIKLAFENGLGEVLDELVDISQYENGVLPETDGPLVRAIEANPKELFSPDELKKFDLPDMKVGTIIDLVIGTLQRLKDIEGYSFSEDLERPGVESKTVLSLVSRVEEIITQISSQELSGQLQDALDLLVLAIARDPSLSNQRVGDLAMTAPNPLISDAAMKAFGGGVRAWASEKFDNFMSRLLTPLGAAVFTFTIAAGTFVYVKEGIESRAIEERKKLEGYFPGTSAGRMFHRDIYGDKQIADLTKGRNVRVDGPKYYVSGMYQGYGFLSGSKSISVKDLMKELGLKEDLMVGIPKARKGPSSSRSITVLKGEDKIRPGYIHIYTNTPEALDKLKARLRNFSDLTIYLFEGTPWKTGADSAKDPSKGDPAALAQRPLGGIDMNAANLNLQIKRDGKGVPLPISQQNLENIKIEGLIPVIIDIKPALTSPLLAQLQAAKEPELAKI